MIYHGDCLEYLRKLPSPGSGVKCLFADPPDNIGLEYSGYYDKMKPEDYYNWLRLLILEALPKCQIFWLSYYPLHDIEICYIVRDILKYRHPSFGANKFIWRYTFSQYNDFDCAYGYRPILRLMRSDAVIYPDAIREVSRRQELGDSRAVGPRVPDNVWSIPRVVGNSGERCDWMKTQHPVRLMERIISFSIDVGKGERFVDLFGGSGSSLKVINNQNVSVVELDRLTCENIQKTVAGVVEIREVCDL